MTLDEVCVLGIASMAGEPRAMGLGAGSSRLADTLTDAGPICNVNS